MDERAALLLILALSGGLWWGNHRDQLIRRREERTLRVLTGLVRDLARTRREARHQARPRSLDLPARVGAVRDAWDRPLRLGAGGRIIYSLGADGRDQEGEGDDLVRFLGELARPSTAPAAVVESPGSSP